MSEEIFATLLQRIQRQYSSNSSSSSRSTASSMHHEQQYTQRPPDEAAYALGKGLARAFLDLIKSSSPTSNSASSSSSSSSSPSLPISNRTQEETFTVLASRQINPSVCQGFFDALLELNCRGSNDHGNFIDLDGLFPACILFTEQKYLDNYYDDDDDDYDVIFDQLTCTIRAYAHYTRNILENNECNMNSNNNNYNESTTLEDQSLYTKIIAKTYSKLQTQAGRMSMLREFTNVAFVGPKQQHKSPSSSHISFSSSSQVYRYMLTPLLVCCVLSFKKKEPMGNDDSSMTEILFMEGIWRQVYTLIDEEYIDEDCIDGFTNENQRHGEDKATDRLNADIPASASVSQASSSYLLNIIEWLTEMLNLYLLSVPSRKKYLRIASKELAHRWLATVLDVGVFVSQSFPLELATDKAGSSLQITTQVTPVISSTTKHNDNSHYQQQKRLIDWFEGIISESLLRWFALLPSYRVEMGNFWVPLKTLMAIHASQRLLSLECTLKLATMAMCHPIKEDVKEILRLLAIAVDKMTNSRSLHPVAFTILKGLGSIFFRDPVCVSNTKYLLATLTRIKKTNTARHIGSISSRNIATENIVNLIQLFDDEASIDEIMCYFVSCEDDLIDPSSHKFSAIQQAGSLALFGLGLLNNTRHQEAAYTSLRRLLLIYPHLGISVLPVMVDSINSAAIRGDGEYMMEQIEFLSTVVVRDTQCAREIWNLLGKELMREHIPATIRSSIIRLYPKICEANKRLYKRVIESMGNMMSITDSCGSSIRDDGNLEIHLAIAATTADLARDAFIRDATDVISWLQNFITDAGWVRLTSPLDREDAPEKAALIHYSIMALHFLVVSDELDFKLVLVVLGKRLCSINNLEEVSKLPHIVLEALVILLGDGESEEEDDSDEDNDRLKAVGVSLQISRSVETLIGLWSHKCLRPELHSDPTIRTTIFRCQQNILNSLTKYSFKALGVDEEVIQTESVAASSSDDKSGTINKTQSGARYNDLKDLISGGIETANMLELHEGTSASKCREDTSEKVPTDFASSLLAFISKILKLEEDALGSSLWQKRHSIREKNSRKKIGRGNVHRSKLVEPLPSLEGVLNAYHENRCQATALGALHALSFENKGKSMDLLSDLAIDATIDPSDPMVQPLYVQSWLNASRSVLSGMVSAISISEPLEKLLRDIQERRSDSPDSMYMFSSTIAMLIPTILGPGDYDSYIKDISNDVWEAYHSHTFEEPDVAKLCLGFVGVCEVSLGTTDRLIEIVNCLEKSVAGYGGLPSFGAYYALSVIAQACGSTSKKETIESQNNLGFIQLVERILIFLINELSKCIKGSQSCIDILVTSIKKKTISAEGIDVLNASTRESLKISESKTRAATFVFIALGICLPTLTEINDRLLLHVLSFLECIEWGCGKGFSLHSVLRVCCQSGILEKREIKEKYEKYLKILQEGVEQGNVGLDDISYAMTAIQSKTVPHFPLEAGRTLSLVSAVSSISSIPCLGQGTHGLLTDSPCLLESATRADITTVVQLVSNGSIDNEQNRCSHQMATTLCGFLASLTIVNGSDQKDNSTVVGDNQMDQLHATQLPDAHIGTGLDIVMTSLQINVKDQNNLQKHPKIGLVVLLGCLEVLSLPAQFSVFLLEILSKENDSMKIACIKLLLSQMKGRPRAVFDGREFVNSALKISKMPIITMRKLLGEKEAAEVFIESIGEMLSKFISHEVDTVIENIFQFCTSLIDRNSTLIVRFFRSINRLLHQAAADDKSPRFSPKLLKSIQIFLEQKAFLCLCDTYNTTSATEGVSSDQITNIIDAYADCLIELPDTLLFENENKLSSAQNCDNFSGKCLRIRVNMTLIRKNCSSLSSPSYREIASSIAWIFQQLIASRDEIFSSKILQVTCTIAEASCRATADGKKELIISFLDNLLMVDSSASFVGLEILAALVYQNGYGSDGDLSLLRSLGTSIGKWVDLPPQILKKAFKLAVHDLPFNLAMYTRREKLSGVVFNRLWSVYVKWQEQCSDEATLAPLRRSLICCRDTNSTTNVEDIVMLVNSIVSE